MTEPTTRTIKASEARQNFASLLNDVFRLQERVVIEKSGIPVAAVISSEDFERFQKWDRDSRERHAVLEEFRRPFRDIPDEKLEREIENALKEVRQEMRAERNALKRAG